MSNYSRYMQEREGSRTIEDEHGFLTYKFEDDHVMIQDLWVVPEMRQKKIATRYADQVTEEARKLGYTRLGSSVDIRAKNATESLTVILAYGFRVYNLDNNEIYLIKEI